MFPGPGSAGLYTGRQLRKQDGYIYVVKTTVFYFLFCIFYTTTGLLD